MKNFRAADKSHAGGDEKHDINFHWPYRYLIDMFTHRPRISYGTGIVKICHKI